MAAGCPRYREMQGCRVLMNNPDAPQSAASSSSAALPMPRRTTRSGRSRTLPNRLPFRSDDVDDAC
jgi:hypothetical protein